MGNPEFNTNETNRRKRRRTCKDDDENADTVILPGLPRDIALDCLSRLPTKLHPDLRTVCKDWHSLLSSPTVYSKPSKGLTNEWLYVRLRLPDHAQRWFAWNPKKRICLPLPHFPSKFSEEAGFAVVRGKLYSIGGYCKESANLEESAEVWAYDPFLNRWDSLSPMRVRRSGAAVGTIGGKIYVLGGMEEVSSDWAEVYDPSANLWTSLSICPRVPENLVYQDCAVLNGKVFGLFHRCLGIFFDPSSSSLTTLDVRSYNTSNRIMPLFLTWNRFRKKTAVVKGILFGYFHGKIRGYDFEKSEWLVLHGVRKHLQKGLYKATLANVGDNLCVIRQNGSEVMFSCLNIRKYPGLLCCNVMWCHSVVSPCREWSIKACVSCG